MAARSLLVLDAAYSLSTIRDRGIEHSITSRDLDGYFDHVWSVHPFVGADSQNDSVIPGPIQIMTIHPRHTVVEAQVGRFRWLRRVPLANFLVSQVVLVAYLLRLIRKNRVSVVRVGDPYYLGLIGWFLTRVNRIPLAIRINGNYDAIFESIGRLAYPRILRRRSIEKRIDRFVLPRADLVAAVNEDALIYATRNGARPERSTVFRYGNLIDPVHFGEPSARPLIRDEIGLTGTPYIVCVGRLEPVKHPEDVIQALAVARGEIDGLNLVMVGDGSMRDVIERTADELGLADNVLFVGDKDQTWIASCLADAAAVVAPMAGRALVESLLGGAPVVAYDVDWHSEIVEDGVSGLLVPYRDIQSLGARLVDVIGGRYEGIGVRGRERALREMDPETLTRHERAHFDLVLAHTS